MRLLSNLAFFLAGLIVAVAVSGHAQPEFELMLGQTKFHAREDGVWWQSGPSAITDNKLISGSYLLGMKWKHIRFGYTRLGDYSGTNWASVRDEDANHVLTRETCDPNTARDCPALYSGRGRAQGVYVGPVAEKSWGGLSALAEVGLLFFRSTYDVTVCRPYDNNVVPSGECFDYNHATGDHKTWYWGVGASYKLFRDASVVLLYRQYWSLYQQGAKPDGDVGLTGGRARQVLAGVSIPF